MIALEPGQQWLSQFRLIKELVAPSERRPHIWLAEKHGAADKIVLKFLRSGPPSPMLVRRLADWRATQVRWFMPLLGVHTSGEQMALELPFIADDNAQLRGAPYPRWSAWLEQVIDVVQKLHRDSFVHGDIKLSNIRRDAQGHPVLSDPWLPGDGKSPYTASHERLNGGPISVQDDLYALGALMHELATGYPPRYPGLDAAKPPSPRHEMPAEALEAMHALLSPNPARRPTLTDVLARLAPLNNTHPQAADSPKLVVSNSIGAAASSAPTVRAPVSRPPPARVPATVPAAASVTRASAPAPTVPSVVMLAAADAKAEAAQIRTPLPPRAAPRIAVTALEIPSPANEPFEPAPVQVGSPSWERPSKSGVSVDSASPFQSRASVWRWPVILLLLAAAIAAFVWLPDEVKQSAFEQFNAIAARNGIVVASPSAMMPGAPAQDFRMLAEGKLKAEQSRDRSAQIEQELRAGGVAARNIPSFVAAVDARTRGLAAFDRRDFTTAAADFESAIKGFDATRRAVPQLHSAALTAGNAALSQCLREQAIAEFRYALALMPNDAAAKEGVARAQVCEDVFARVSAGARAEDKGDTAAAQKEYETALQLDPKSASARDALSALTGQVGDLQYSREVAAALEDLRTHRYSAAAGALAAADKLKANSPELQRLSQQLSEVHSEERLQALRAEASDDERAEHWAEALDAYRAMLAVDANLVVARDGARRSEERMQLDAELAGYIDKPDRLEAGEVRAAAVDAMGRARLLASRGPRIESQLSRIGVLLLQFEAPVHVSVTSDSLTHVVIYRVGDLGKFNDRSISLKPGKYTFVGSRLGYRDIRREIEVAPSQANAAVEIHCEEQI